MDTIGKHLLLELHGCDKALLNDLNYIKKCMTESAEKANATIVNSTFKAFDPQGVTGVVVLEESHISIHTWPEKEYASLDFYTCGNAEPVNAKQHMENALQAAVAISTIINRGLTMEAGGMKAQATKIEDIN